MSFPKINPDVMMVQPGQDWNGGIRAHPRLATGKTRSAIDVRLRKDDLSSFEFVGADPPPRTSEIPRPPMPVGTASPVFKVVRGGQPSCVDSPRKTWRPELEPARVAEFPQPAHKARAPNTEQFTACTLRIAGWIKKYNEARPHQGRWRQNPDADLRGCNADDEGENDRSLTANGHKT